MIGKSICIQNYLVQDPGFIDGEPEKIERYAPRSCAHTKHHYFKTEDSSIGFNPKSKI